MPKVKEKTEEKPVITWDTCEIIKFYAKDLMEQNEIEREDDPEVEELTEEEAWERAAGSDFLFTDEWEYITEYLTEIMVEINPGGGWSATGEDLGWQKRSGYKRFKAESGEDFIKELLPETDCTFRIYRRKDKDGTEYLYIKNSTHDAPMGEHYNIYKAEVCSNCDEIIEAGSEKDLRDIGEGIVCNYCYDHYFREDD